MIRENLKNLVYQTIAQIVPRAILFVFTLYLAAILGKEEFGKYDFALSFGYLVGVFYELGGNVILTKYVARGHFSSFKFSFRFRLITILLTLAVVFSILFMSGLYSEIILNLLYALLGIAFSSLMNLYFAFFRGLRKMNYEAVVLLLQKIIFIGLCFAVFIYRKDASIILLAFAVSMLISWQVIQFIYIGQKHQFVENKKPDEISYRTYLADVMSLALVEVFSVVYFRATQIILEYYGGFSQVGMYGVSYKLIEALTNIPSIIMIVLFPSFARLARENLAEFRKNFNKVLLILFSLGLISCVLCWIFGKPFFALVGKDYDESYIIVRYMCPALFMIFPNYLLTQSLIATDRNLAYANIVFIALIVNVVAAIMLVPSYGAKGSALSVGICEIIIFILAYYRIHSSFRKNAG